MSTTLEAVTAQLAELGHKVTTAESCTGGLLAAELTPVADTSAQACRIDGRCD